MEELLKLNDEEFIKILEKLNYEELLKIEKAFIYKLSEEA